MSEDQDQKTEAPTQRRIQKAFEEGQIGFSSDLLGGLILLIGICYFWLFGGMLFGQLRTNLRVRLLEFDEALLYPERLPDLIVFAFASLVGVILGLLAPLFCVSLLSGGLQTRFNLTMKPLQLKFDRFNPVSGFKKLFSLRAVMRGVTAVAKAAVVATVSYLVIHSELDSITTSGFGSLSMAIALVTRLTLVVSITIAALMVLVGVGDLAFQKWKQYQDLRMSIKDIRDEFKEDNGDPLLKARMRQLAAEMTKKTIAKEVPGATVVVTNPTHFAVALKYDREKNPVPVVVAKGTDHLAKQIIALAKENNVPVVERKPVARYLYAKVNVGQSIPFEMYQALPRF
ncbi:MAG: EscU/YscU/HrcU family type III secretion system export apparatus switch protein [Pirellulaceae bacterium]